MRAICLAIFSLLVAPIASAKAPAIQTILDQISDKCRTPRQWLREKAGEVVLRPSPSAKYAKMTCILDEIRRRDVPTKVGLVTGSTEKR